MPKLKNNLLLLLLLSFFILTETNSQASFVPKQQTRDTLFIDYLEGTYYLYHQIKKEDNLIDIATYYGLDATAISQINGLKDNQIKGRKIIKIPVQYKKVISPRQLSSIEKYNYIPLFYKIKKGDTLYKLFRKYFPKDSTQIKKINSIRDNIIKIDAKLFIGYYPVQPVKKAAVDSKIQSVDLRDTLKLGSDKAKQTLVSTTGAANTFTPPFEKTPHAYVLSNKIPEHSVVEITNPMSNKKITAKVIGKIPPGKYPLDILLLLTKNDASDLGFLDLKFFVSVKYYE